MRYLRNGLTDFGEIWHGDAYSLFRADEWAEVWKIQNPRWSTVAILKIEKSWYLHNCLADFDDILHDDTY